jgi:hypothetical protein
MYISSQFPVSRFSVKTFCPEEKEFDRELRTENFLSVIRSFHEPIATEQVVNQAVERDGLSIS